jgi:fucose 4-O-acetylase-like acetyltransferase
LDNLRIALTVLLIAHHVGQAYGPTGGYWPIQETARAAVLGPFFAVNRSFFMSLFFMIAGYFTVMSCEDKGPRAFLKSRALRLGLPVVVFGLIMIPLQILVFVPPGSSRGSAWPIDVGHLWFLEHLLIFSAVYALWRMIRPAQTPAVVGNANPPGYLAVLLSALAVAVASAVVRNWFPIDRWVYPLGFIRVAPADLPRDLSFYLIGVVAYRQGWVQRFPTKAGLVWLGVGVSAAVLFYAYDLGLNTVLPLRGLAWGIAYPIWESLLCCGMCIGLTVLFRERFNVQGRLGKALAQSQYAAYILHLPVVMLFQAPLVGLAWPPLLKFALVTLLSVPATFLLSNWVRKPLHL